jgi:hypothetical protein
MRWVLLALALLPTIAGCDDSPEQKAAKAIAEAHKACDDDPAEAQRRDITNQATMSAADYQAFKVRHESALNDCVRTKLAEAAK